MMQARIGQVAQSSPVTVTVGQPVVGIGVTGSGGTEYTVVTPVPALLVVVASSWADALLGMCKRPMASSGI